MILTEFVRRLRTHQTPFQAIAQDDNGREVSLFVKTRIVGRPQSGLELLAEWAGYKILSALGVRTPAYHLIDITQSFIDSTLGVLHDVPSGTAFATEEVSSAIPAFVLSADPESIINRKHAAGVVVGDTMLRNLDRHGSNALVAPNAAGGGMLIWFIDNGWLVEGAAGVELYMPPEPCIPRHLFLRQLVESEEDFHIFYFLAEGLSRTSLESHFASAPHEEWTGQSGFPEKMADVFYDRGQQCRALLMPEMGHFPNAGSGA